MKYGIAFSLLFFATSIAAQQTPVHKLPERGYFPSYRGLQLRMRTSDSSRQHAVSAEPGLYKMRQDGMPCLVPDTEGMPVMPNAFQSQKSKGKIQKGGR
jgi:hypothetical protein